MRVFGRANNGQFSSGEWSDGHELSEDHKANIRLKAQQRARTGYRHIHVLGKVYANLTEASDKMSVSARTLKRYAESDKYPNIYFIN